MKDDATLPARWELGVVAVRGEYQALVFRGVSVTPFLPLVLRV